jgi:3-deoxy-manno-octulosonate cytidylyltransferase (CMP-KDO synthetase)
MKTVGIIPARYKSSRFPGKPLVSLLGKPMILHVASLTAEALGKDNTFVATDNNEIAKVVSQAGFNCVLTSESALTGTDRIWEAAQQINADYYVNIQGDEPLLNPLDINLIVDEKKRRKNGVINGMHLIQEDESVLSINIPKVIFSEIEHRLIYMSRLPIPGFKNKSLKPEKYWKQVSIYAFNYEELEKYGEFGRKSYLEEKEDIEILRFFDVDIPVYMIETNGVSYAVDTPEDVQQVETALKANKRNQSP